WWPRCPRESRRPPRVRRGIGRGILGRRCGIVGRCRCGLCRRRRRRLARRRWRRRSRSLSARLRRRRVGQRRIERGRRARGVLDVLADVIDRIEVRVALRLRGHLVDLLLEVGKLGFAHRFVELALEFRRHAPDLPHPLSERAQRTGQFLRPDRDQRNDADEEELAPANVKHWASLQSRRAGANGSENVAGLAQPALRCSADVAVLPATGAPGSIVFICSVLAGSSGFSSSARPFLNDLMPLAKSPIRSEILPRPPNSKRPTANTIIQCQTLIEPMRTSSVMRGWGPHGHPLGHTGPPDYSGLPFKLSAGHAKDKMPPARWCRPAWPSATGKPLRALPFLSP